MSRLACNQQGLTIVEIMIAVGILGVGLLALSSAIPLAAYGIQEGNQLSSATFLANQRMEQVRNATWRAGPPCVDNLGFSASSTTAPAQSCGGTATTFPDENLGSSPPCTFTPLSGSGCYTRTVRITDCGVAPGCSGIADGGLRQVIVTVSYRPMTGVGVAPAGTTKSSVITMYISQR